MSKRDFFHEAVCDALDKEDWDITDDPLKIEWGGATIKIDLGAERLLAAERGDEKIAVEIKSFISRSPISEFHTALGQYIGYRRVLRDMQPDRELFLAVPVDAYEEFFRTEYAQSLVAEEAIHLLIYDPLKKVIVTWTK